MLALLSTFMILTIAAFAAIALGRTLAGSWDLIVAALNAGNVAPVPTRTQRRVAGRRAVTVSVRTRASMSSAAA